MEETTVSGEQADVVIAADVIRSRGVLRFKVEGRDQQPQPGDKVLIGAIVKSRGWLERILSAEVASQRELAAREGYGERSTFLRASVTLRPAAIADILELNQRGSEMPFQALQESVPKALRRFRKKPGFTAYMAAMEDFIPHWNLLLPSEELGQKSTSK